MTKIFPLFFKKNYSPGSLFYVLQSRFLCLISTAPIGRAHSAFGTPSVNSLSYCWTDCYPAVNHPENNSALAWWPLGWRRYFIFSNGNNGQNNCLDFLKSLPYGLQLYPVFAKCCGTLSN